MNGFLTILFPMNQLAPVPMTISYFCKKFSESRVNHIHFSSAYFYLESRAGFMGMVVQSLEGPCPYVVLDYCLLKILYNSGVRDCAFSFCTKPYELHTRFCLSTWYTLCAMLVAVVWLSFQISFSCPKLNSQVMAVFVKCGSSSLIKSSLQQISVSGRSIPCHLGIRGIVLEFSVQVMWFWFWRVKEKSLSRRGLGEQRAHMNDFQTLPSS